MNKKIVLTGFCAFLLSVLSITFADTEVNLNDSTSGSGFSIKDSLGTSIARFQGDGKVGIGTTNPSSPLTVNGMICSAELGWLASGTGKGIEIGYHTSWDTGWITSYDRTNAAIMPLRIIFPALCPLTPFYRC